MSTARKKSVARVARGGPLSPKSAKLAASYSKRLGDRAAAIRQKHAAS